MICIHNLDYKYENTIYLYYSVKFSHPKVYTLKLPTYSSIDGEFLELNIYDKEWFVEPIKTYLLHN